MPEVFQFHPRPGAPDGTITRLLTAHDSYVRARELRVRATCLAALLGLPLALALAPPVPWPRSLSRVTVLAFGAALLLTLGCALAEWVWYRRRARLASAVETGRPSVP
jgi:hypothetical protein